MLESKHIATHTLRGLFLDFFVKKGHRLVKSDLLVPKDDPTVLFTSAGMNQFKPQFMGHITDFTRATSCQKCLRTDDLPEVGRTPYHHTFFEMLGNFSFGDYFKEEAITWAWEFLTEVLGIPKERLFVSVHKSDEEAYKIWREKIGLAEEKITRLGDKTNFWPSDAIKEGPNGPCGPCSEIFFDQGGDFSSKQGRHNCGVDCDCGRFAEIWNLVFTQFDRRGKGKLEPLPRKNIDTGMGLERLAAVLQGKKSNFEIDIFKPILNAIKASLGIEITDKNKRVAYPIADHMRAVVFAVADGVLPSNEGRGYVIRKLIRKSVWHGRQIGSAGVFLREVADAVIAEMSGPYPELKERRDIVINAVSSEEERFLNTLDNGLNLLTEKIEQARPAGRLDGKVCFVLYDTYGFPFEMTKEISAQEGLTVDEVEFNQLMEEQRRRSQAALKCSDDIFAHRNLRKQASGMKFVGYDELKTEATVKALLRDDKPLQSIGRGDEADLILDICPFYGESGGQAGDKGMIVSDKGLNAQVIDTIKIDDVIACRIKVLDGTVSVGDNVIAEVDEFLRKQTAKHHSATHLLQAALRRVLGSHIQQAGSFVAYDRLRFDFSHFGPVSDEQIVEIERLVNRWIQKDIPVEKLIMPVEEARKMNALAFFGEKYGDIVRVVKIGDVSIEFCGGTHVDATGEIGMFMIQSEKSVSSGVRRIEAIVGMSCYNSCAAVRKVIKSLQFSLKTSVDKLEEAVLSLREENSMLRKQLAYAKSASVAREVAEMLAKAEEVCGVKLACAYMQGADLDLLRKACDELRRARGKAVGLFIGDGGKAPMAVLCAGKEAVERGFNAKNAIEAFKKKAPVSGGGRPDMAQMGLKSVKMGFNELTELLMRELKAYSEGILK